MMRTGCLKPFSLLIFAILVLLPVLIAPSRADPGPKADSGLLLAYTDENRTNLVPVNDAENYLALSILIDIEHAMHYLHRL